MTPKIASAEVRRAREEGWYATTWNQMAAYRRGQQVVAARPQQRQPSTRSDVLQAVAAGADTRKALRAALPALSEASLTAALKELCRRGDPMLVVHRTVDPERPSATIATYVLNAAGQRFLAGGR
jgi:hypothetical protein